MRRFDVGKRHHQRLDAQVEDDVLATDARPLGVTLDQELLQVGGPVTQAKSETLKTLNII